jgi:hypothetical protein
LPSKLETLSSKPSGAKITIIIILDELHTEVKIRRVLTGWVRKTF